MSAAGGHAATFDCPTREDGDRLVLGVEWVARCSCGRTSADAGTPDGTLASAREWADEHLRGVSGAAPELPRSDEPDPVLDSYDAFLRGVTDE